MKRTLHLSLALGAVSLGLTANAQRYLTEVFTNDQITITSDVVYGTNINFFESTLSSPDVPAEVVELQTAVQTGNPIPAPYFDPDDASTSLKVIASMMDIYEPDQSVDTETARPMVLYLHTGNAVPPPLNGSPNGLRTDSTAVEICKRMARRGYVAVSMSYRLGWNPFAATEQERRGQLLNAIYRAIQDTRQCVRTHKEIADGENTYAIDPDKIIVFGEGTGGYIALANATLDDAAKIYIPKFCPDPFDLTVSYIDSTQVGNIAGFNGALTLYQPNGYDYDTHFCVNMGGSLADTSWMDPGDVPMVAFHTVFDPFAPFTEGIVIVPTTGGPVVPVQGSNLFMELVNDYGNNAAFATLPDGDDFTDRARSLYGSAQTHSATTVNVRTDVEGLFPFVTPNWPANPPPPQLSEEASPWQFWNPTGPLALAEVAPGVTAHQASSLSNPNMSAAKARAYIDTVMGYLNPRIVCALELGPCSLVGLSENSPIAQGVEVFPNPASDRVTFTSAKGMILSYQVFDVNGRLVRTASVNADRAVMERQGLKAGAYTVQLRFKDGAVTRQLMLD